MRFDFEAAISGAGIGVVGLLAFIGLWLLTAFTWTYSPPVVIAGGLALGVLFFRRQPWVFFLPALLSVIGTLAWGAITEHVLHAAPDSANLLAGPTLTFIVFGVFGGNIRARRKKQDCPESAATPTASGGSDDD